MQYAYFDTYKEVKKLTSSGVRKHIRSAALSGLSLISKLQNVENQLRKPRVQFIYLHHVFKDEEYPLRKLLSALQNYHTFISYSGAVDKIIQRNIDRPYIAISLDDGFKNNLRAAEIFDEYGIKACFFLNPSIINETHYAKIAAYCKARLHFPPVEFLNWNDVRTLQKSGHEIGSHTMDHINIADTPLDQVAEDMGRTFLRLKQECGGVKHFAFPYGRFSHFSEAGRKACFDAGYISCATAERGCHINHNTKLRYDQLCILRDHVMLSWNLDHILYFMGRNARQCKAGNNLFPYATGL